MNKPKFFAFALFFIFLLSYSNSFAQTKKTRQSEPSYEVVLQMLTASNDSTKKTEIPANLTKALTNLRKISHIPIIVIFLQIFRELKIREILITKVCLTNSVRMPDRIFFLIGR